MDSVPQTSIVNNYVPTPQIQSAIDRIGVLRARERDSTRDCRFAIADLMNCYRFDDGPQAQALRDRYGDEEYFFFRHCAWVGHKWPKKDRIPGKSWDYFKNNIPGQPAKQRSAPPYSLSDSGSVGVRCFMVSTNERGKAIRTYGTLEQFKQAVRKMEGEAG